MKLFILILVISVFWGCEDVIEVDAPSEPPRLSIDALIRVDEETTVTNIVISASLTSSFFDETSTAKLEEITIRNANYEPNSPSDQDFIVLTESAPGRYEGSKNTSFFTDGGTFELLINYNGEKFRALTEYVPTVPIDSLQQGEGTLFSGDETEVLVSFTDNPERDDFYLFDFDFGEYLVTEDEFYQGQTFEFSYFYDEDVEPGRKIDIDLLGVNEAFYNYMNQLIVQAGGDQGPFQTPSSTVRGNIIKVTTADNSAGSDTVDERNNFALGYFAICQTFSRSIEIRQE